MILSKALFMGRGGRGGAEGRPAPHLAPVVGDLLEAEALADPDQVEDVLLEAGAPEADRGV